MTYFLDTSALLNGAYNIYSHCYISPISIKELEEIKSSPNKSDRIRYLARNVVRDLLNSSFFSYTFFTRTQTQRVLHRYKFLKDIPDHYIIADAVLLANTTDVTFVTSDGAQLLFARQIPKLDTLFYDNNPQDKPIENCGWSKYYPTPTEMSLLYSDPTLNILKCKSNEFAKIYEGSELKDILFWTGHKYRSLKYKDIKNSFLNLTIQPLNIEQKMAFDLLQNTDIPVKLLFGTPGTGKDYLMLTHALDLVQHGAIEKIIFIRNLIPFKDAPEIGYLAGSLQEKIAWGMGPLASILGEEGLQNFEDQGIIEAVNLGFIRGCSWNNSILYVSEGQNITGGGYKLLVSRCGQGSQLWINGDVLQTDAKRFEENNGITRLLQSLSGNELFGAVKLIKSERSKTAELASII